MFYFLTSSSTATYKRISQIQRKESSFWNIHNFYLVLSPGKLLIFHTHFWLNTKFIDVLSRFWETFKSLIDQNFELFLIWRLFRSDNEYRSSDFLIDLSKYLRTDTADQTPLINRSRIEIEKSYVNDVIRYITTNGTGDTLLGSSIQINEKSLSETVDVIFEIYKKLSEVRNKNVIFFGISNISTKMEEF